MLVIQPDHRINLGPTQAVKLFLEQQVVKLSLEALSQKRNQTELPASSQQILARRPDLKTVVLSMLVQRFPDYSEEQIMVIAGIPREELRHTGGCTGVACRGRSPR